MRRFDRRRLLQGTAALGASAALCSLRRVQVVKVVDDELLHWIAVTPRDEALRRAARELAHGLDPALLLAALLVSAAREFPSDRAQFNHAALGVSAMLQLSLEARDDERVDLALWKFDHFKEDQARYADDASWRFAKIEDSKLPAPQNAKAALVDALEKWDAPAADVALVALLRSTSIAETYALVWEYGLRCRGNIGHKAIYAALSYRALALAQRCAEDVLRSVVRSFFIGGKSDDAAPFEESRAIVARGIDRKRELAADDLGPTRELLGEIRTAKPTELPSIAAKLASSGARANSLFDAARIAAAEIGVADPSIAPLHALTSLNSLAWIAANSGSKRVADLALLQAPAWMAGFRSALASKTADGLEFRIESLREAKSSDADDPRSLAIRALAAASDREKISELRVEVAERARRFGTEIHQYKHAAAALEEAELAGDFARPFVLATLASHEAPKQTDDERWSRIREAKARAK